MNDNSLASAVPLRVAMIGASGIGKNHAAWFAKNGAQIVAFAGSSPASLETTAAILQDKLGYTPPGYTDINELLQTEAPDAVCIATPPHLHFEQAKLCLQNKVHTLCEKPLVYDGDLAGEVLVTQGQQLVEAAAQAGVLLGTQMQYPFIAEQLCAMAEVLPEEIESFTMEMETKNLKPGRSHETIWIELAPHPLSVLQRIASGGTLDESSIRCQIAEQETVGDFTIRRTDGSTIEARLIARCNPNTTSPLRRFTINGHAIDYSGRKNENGDFLTYLTDANTEVELPDLVDLLIGNFTAACGGGQNLFVTGADGVKNVEWMVKILEAGQRI
jgi:predicted dehydrogenase